MPLSSPGPSAPTYLAWSIFNTICCCTPLGIIAIVFSCRTDTANLIGDPTRANAHSRLAKKLNIAALVIGIVFVIIFIAIYVVIFQKIQDEHFKMGQ
ncbi:interferon-induced transmembrane protein 3 [Silurus asotus]|uniref:Interferon-induced transmembrane protein 3 n=1 Tax=Silurus asotus TaxID=30991 RepID=A0AAD5F9G4_SILAS|nr:interferon-induced transmembrane protein 3 [Silurus asotus]